MLIRRTVYQTFVISYCSLLSKNWYNKLKLDEQRIANIR